MEGIMVMLMGIAAGGLMVIEDGKFMWEGLALATLTVVVWMWSTRGDNRR